jgi:hypothetical protein
MYHLSQYIERQKRWSTRVFGPGKRTLGLTAHIRKELDEIEANPLDLEEWIDVIILGLDGAWRTGAPAAAIWMKMVEKQGKNLVRTWGPVVSEDLPVEHIRDESELCGSARRWVVGGVAHCTRSLGHPGVHEGKNLSGDLTQWEARA